MKDATNIIITHYCYVHASISLCIIIEGRFPHKSQNQHKLFTQISKEVTVQT